MKRPFCGNNFRKQAFISSLYCIFDFSTQESLYWMDPVNEQSNPEHLSHESSNTSERYLLRGNSTRSDVSFINSLSL